MRGRRPFVVDGVRYAYQAFDPAFLSELDRPRLRRALVMLRRQDARPFEISPAAAQYNGIATTRSVMAEFRRRGWKVPKRTVWERA